MTEASYREMFDSLLDATLPDAIDYGMPESAATQARVQAWQVHAHLRNRADYSLDDRRSTRAAERLARDLESCKALVL